MENVREIFDEDDVPRIECSDRSYFNQVQEAVTAAFCEVVDQHVDLNSDQKNNCKTVFQSLFNNAVSACVVYTKHSERSNSESESYLNEVLLPKYDKALVDTTRKRKMYPAEIVGNYAKRFRMDRDCLKDLTIESSQKQAAEEPKPTSHIDDQIRQCYSNTVATVTRIKTMEEVLMTKAENISRVKHVLNSKQEFFGNKIRKCLAKCKGEDIHAVHPSLQPKRKMCFSTFKDEIGTNFNLFENYKKT